MFYRLPIVPVIKIFWYNPFSEIYTGLSEKSVPTKRFNELSRVELIGISIEEDFIFRVWKYFWILLYKKL